MKHIILTLSLILGLGTSVFAKDIKMQCDFGQNQLFKYSDNIFKDNSYMRKDGQWVDFCDGMLAFMLREYNNTATKIGDPLIQDKSATCNFELTNMWQEEMIITWLVDFESMTAQRGYTVETASPKKWTDFRWDKFYECTAF